MTTTTETYQVETNGGEVLATGLNEAEADMWVRDCQWLTFSEMVIRRKVDATCEICGGIAGDMIHHAATGYFEHEFEANR